MIGVFARMFGQNERVLEVQSLEDEEGYQVTASDEGAYVTRDTMHVEEVPAGFVQTMQTEGGEVHMSPFVEALRAWLKRGRSVGDEAADAGEDEAA